MWKIQVFWGEDFLHYPPQIILVIVGLIVSAEHIYMEG